MTPKLSIITVCYNEPYLDRTCRSIINQTWQDFEWIVIDGGSNAETLAIFEKYKNRINTFISEKDSGIYNAMNKGIKLAKGEYLNFMNAGDSYYYNDALKDVFENKTYTDGVLYGVSQFFSTADRTGFSWIQPLPTLLTKKFFYDSCISHQASFIRRELFEKYGLYNENYRSISDWVEWLVFLENGVTFLWLPYIIGIFSTGGMSSSELAKKEHKNFINQYFSDAEKKAFSTQLEYTIWEKIFSIKDWKRRKIITILGIRIKYKKK
jgi:glycosyltransferase involved in cell wall biosynthesis